MNSRVNIAANSAPYKAMINLEMSLQTTSLTNIQKELIKTRASQINQCAFCLDMHTKDALKYGETAQRLFLLNAWRETDLFTEEEKLILAMTEEITQISQNGLTDETYEKASKLFDEEKIKSIIMAIVTINMWNRIAITTHLQVSKQ
ncbi:carboxymuconolactone decarboxylase family protein [Chryseobacterium chendengshani]|uniref:carboxymuconolactone decarboxylase family protein n=1 Tax=Chryseobacterium sp. LJ668 TaxID=2864040 RepID=UPI001C6914E3|nr:carboxymuconolactone decarboxylase family protein [Chryseobacterium sp. LJ668]MBW8524080.1 carboxymuconolactone decarboxylase family protein [Chryseobacterium sp. LJ668]QYK17016.1 carboxymuconolactone decarboxylase family protein [Chryseobacterium sp. LJ668]